MRYTNRTYHLKVVLQLLSAGDILLMREIAEYVPLSLPECTALLGNYRDLFTMYKSFRKGDKARGTTFKYRYGISPEGLKRLKALVAGKPVPTPKRYGQKPIRVMPEHLIFLHTQVFRPYKPLELSYEPSY